MQGPPGTGKTYTAAEQILELIAHGRTVGTLSASPGPGPARQRKSCVNCLERHGGKHAAPVTSIVPRLLPDQVGVPGLEGSRARRRRSPSNRRSFRQSPDGTSGPRRTGTSRETGPGQAGHTPPRPGALPQSARDSGSGLNAESSDAVNIGWPAAMGPGDARAHGGPRCAGRDRARDR